MAVSTRDKDEKNIKFCKNCVYHARDYKPFWFLLIPVIGWIILLIAWMSEKALEPYCKFAGSKNLVNGRHQYTESCHSERISSGAFCGPEGKNFVAKNTPLQKVDSKIIMEEVLQRGILEVIKDYKRAA